MLKIDKLKKLHAIEARRIGPITVLHIEDDRAVGRAVARRLRLDGYHAIGAASHFEAMQLIEDGLVPDLILTDYRLPGGMTSDATVTEISNRLGFKPFTVMLASLSHQEIETLSSMADRIFAKPADMDLLLYEMGVLLGPHA